MLEQLPQEILDSITNALPTEDVKGLSLTSKHLHSATLQAVWNSTVIRAWNKDGTLRIKLADLPLHRLLLARHFDLRFIVENYSRICLHSQRLHICRAAADESIIARPVAFNSFFETITPILEKCEKDHWKSFRWGLGTCIPAPILGTNGIVARRQSALSNLKLTTHPFCRQRKTSPETTIDLSAFTHLLNISWTGPKSENLKTLATALENNKSHLESLELDLVDWPYMRRELGYQNDGEVRHGLKARDHMDEIVFGLIKRSPCIKFPNMHTLVLSHVPLTATLAEAIDFEILKSLTIQSCPLWYEFVLTMAQRKAPVKLKKLELQESLPKSNVGWLYEHEDPISLLLDSFEGLEEFYLSQAGGMCSIYTWDHVRHHKSTLKIFVNHSRSYDRQVRDWRDHPDMMLSYFNTTDFRDYPTSTSFYQLDLEFIALSCAPEFLIKYYVLYPFSRKECLKIVHVRQTPNNIGPGSKSWAITTEVGKHPIENTSVVDEGDDPIEEYLHFKFWAFIQWAFSSKGIKSLEYIVFGDYGRPERTSRGNLLICRKGYGSQDFRIIRESCPAPEWDYIKKKYGDALRSCPSYPLFDTPDVQRVKHQRARLIASAARSR